MFCKNCGAKLDDGTRFCTNCGQNTGVNNTKTYQQDTQTNNTYSNPESSNQASYSAPATAAVNGKVSAQSRKTAKFIVIGAAALALVVVILIFSAIIKGISGGSQEKKMKDACIDAVKSVDLDDYVWMYGLGSDTSLTLERAFKVISKNVDYTCELSKDDGYHIVVVDFHFEGTEDYDYDDYYSIAFFVDLTMYDNYYSCEVFAYNISHDSCAWGHTSFSYDEVNILDTICALYAEKLRG